MSRQTKAELLQQIGELTEALQRERADAENIRRRSEEDRRQALGAGKRAAIEQLVPLLDNLHRAFAFAPKDIASNSWVKGVLGLDKQLESLMNEFGLTKIETVGKQFDPETMEAVSTEEGEGPEHVVLEELQSGYLLNGQVVRVAMVKVRG